MATAVANAVFHATGRRIRGFPIRIESIRSSRLSHAVVPTPPLPAPLSDDD